MIYFDTSFVLPLILREPTSDHVEAFLEKHQGEAFVISHWTRLEVSSALAKQVRMRKLPTTIAKEMEVEFDNIVAEAFSVLLPLAEDFAVAGRYLQHHESGLRAGDALHLAVAANNHVNALYTLDNTLLNAGTQLGLPVKPLTSRA
jgi:predicted nucleic acid-binding protein